MNKKPKHFTIFKVIGVIGLIVAFIGFVKLLNGFGNFGTNDFMFGMFMGPFGLFVGFSCLMIGFRPEISRIATKSAKYIQEENKDELKDIATTSADITSEAFTVTASAIRKGLNETLFCKYCGKEIDSDSIFCRHCGQKQ